MAMPKFTNPYKHGLEAKTDNAAVDPTPALGAADSNRLERKDWGIREQKASVETPGYRKQDGN